MLCGACAVSIGKNGRSRSRSHGASDQLCSRCGDLLGRDEIEFHTRRKKSQLEKFGLSGARRLLRKRKPLA